MLVASLQTFTTRPTTSSYLIERLPVPPKVLPMKTNGRQQTSKNLLIFIVSRLAGLYYIHYHVGSLFWADDIVIISESKSGLQNSLNDLNNYCLKNLLKVNTQKTKCMVMNKGGKLLQSNTFYFRSEKLETVKHLNTLVF